MSPAAAAIYFTEGGGAPGAETLNALAGDVIYVDAASKLLEQALASALENLGEGHPSVAPAAANLAMVLEALGKSAEAMATIQIAVRAVAGQPEGSYHRANVERIAEFLQADDSTLA